IRPPCSETTARAARESATARRLYPRPLHSRMTSDGDAAASARTLGKSFMNARYGATTRGACVCWSMTSETRTRYGVGRIRQGYNRRRGSYHSRSARCARAIERSEAGAKQELEQELEFRSP